MELVSIIIPFFNEEKNVSPLMDELIPKLKELKKDFEIICIDDGSTDNTLNELKRQKEKYPEVLIRVIIHKENFGQSAAYATGFSFSKGDIIVTMDGDMQYFPEDVVLVVKKLMKEDADMVSGIRRDRKDSIIKKIPSKIGNILRRIILNDHITDMGCTLRAVRKEAIKEIPLFKGMHRFLPSILKIKGYKVIECEVRHRARKYGKSKYGIMDRLFVYLLDCFGMWWFKKRFILPPKKRIKDVV